MCDMKVCPSEQNDDKRERERERERGREREKKKRTNELGPVAIAALIIVCVYSFE